MVRRAARIVATLILSLIVITAVAWAAMALWFDGPHSRVLAGMLAGALVLTSVVLAALVRPLLRGLVVALMPVVLVALWWTAIPPSNTRNWTPDVARTARASFDGSRVTIQNVRNFTYRSETDYDQRWETRTYDLDQVKGVDLFMSFWGPTEIAHTIVSWEFADGQHLAISIETRKEQGESYSALRGFFRQYELYYVVADERDLVGLRTNYRGEQVYLYRIQMPAAQARALLVDYLDEVNQLADHPRVVQRADAELHDNHSRPCAKHRRRRPARLAAARQRPPRSTALRARSDRHGCAIRGAAGAQRHHGKSESCRRLA